MKPRTNSSNHTTNQTSDRIPQAVGERSGRSADPFDKNKSTGSLIWNTARLLEAIFSHRGMFWLGVSITLICFVLNVWFYYGLMLLLGLVPYQAALGGFGISFATTLFELMPQLRQRSSRLALHHIFNAGSKPNSIPNLPESVVSDAPQIIADYKNTEKNNREFFKTMRWVAISAESFLGVLFIGNIGVGIRSLMKLITFGASIFGCEWGVSLALRAAESELPPEIKKQFEELITNSGNRLNLNRI